MSSFLKLVSVLDYLVLTNGNRTRLSDSYISLFRSSPLQFFDNPFDLNEADLDCQPTKNFALESVSCNILNNYGSDLLTILGFTAIVLPLAAMGWGISKISDKRKNLKRILSWIFFIPNLLFNLDLLVSIIDGSFVEISRLSVLNIFNSNGTKGQNIGTGLSSVLLLFYCGYTSLVLVVCRRLSKHRKLDPQNTLDSMLGFIFEEFHEDARWGIVYYTPVLQIAKAFACQVVLVVMGDHGVDQVMVLLGIEVFGLLLTVLQAFG